MAQVIKALGSGQGEWGYPIPDDFPIPVSDEMGILEAPLLYLLDVARRGRVASQRTVNTYAEHLLDYFDALEQTGIDWRHATLDTIAAYRDRMAGQISPHTGRLYARSTVNARLRTVERFYHHARRRGWIDQVPFTHEEVSAASHNTMLAHLDTSPTTQTANAMTLREVGTEIPQPVPSKTLRAYMAAADRPYDLIAAWMLATGMRAMEVAALSPEMIPDKSGPTGDEVDRIRLTVTKGGKPRTVFPPRRLTIWTDRYAAEERPRIIKRARQRNPGYKTPSQLFLTRSGAPVYTRRIVEEVSKTFTRVGAPEVTSHWLRHTYAMTMLTSLQRQAANNGDLNPLLVLRDLLGHSNIATTSKYLNAVTIYGDDLHASVESAFDYTLGNTLNDGSQEKDRPPPIA